MPAATGWVYWTVRELERHGAEGGSAVARGDNLRVIVGVTLGEVGLGGEDPVEQADGPVGVGDDLPHGPGLLGGRSA